MDERRIGALEAAAETDRAQFFGAGVAAKGPRDAGAEPGAIGLAGGSTERIAASSHLATVRSPGQGSTAISGLRARFRASLDGAI
jgi:hypothetical protein